MACEQGWQIQEEWMRAIHERTLAQTAVGNPLDGPYTKRNQRLNLANTNWKLAVDARLKHIAECPVCFREPPR
jgi:hypothetical protein